MDECLPDPEFQTIALCPGRNGQVCGKAMGPLRVYLAKGAHSNPENRGKLVQTCTDFSCLKTIYLTPAYKHEDALCLVFRKAYPGHPDGLPRLLRPPSPPPPPTAVQGSQIACANEFCITKQGARTQGNKSCIDRRCKSCCVKAAADVRNRGLGRSACVTHAQVEIIGNNIPPRPFAPSLPHAPVVPPSTPTPTARAHASLPTQPQASGSASTSRNSTGIISDHPPTLTATTRAHASLPSQPQASGSASTSQNSTRTTLDHHLPSPAPTQGPMVFTTPPIPRLAPLASSSTPAAPSKSRTRTLAKPLGGAWAMEHQNAEQQKDTVKNMKIQQHEMDERKKWTCLLIFYHTCEEPPVHIDHYIPTFPDFQLSAYPDLVRDLELPSNARLDIWEGEWITIDLTSVRAVEKGQRIILKLWPSFRQGLDDRDCPGIEDELANQSKHRRVLKCPAESFVSPMKKVPRHIGAASVHSVSDTLARPTITPSIRSKTTPPLRKTHLSKPVTQSSTTRTLKAEPSPETVLVDKMWPHDFYVCTVAAGLEKIEKMMGRNRSKGQLRKSEHTLKSAFHKAFPDTKWAKTTFCKYRKLWNKADEDVQRLFVDLGESSKALFKTFITALDDPHHIPSSSENDDSDSESESSFEIPAPSTSIPSAGSGSQPSEDLYMSHIPNHILSINPVKSFRQRLEDIYDVLREILLDPLQSEFFNTVCASFAGSSQHPAQNSTHSYEHDYYGFDGYTSITAALRAMFLEYNFDLTNLAPLTWDYVIQDVLYPEAVTLLISDELGISQEEAVAFFQRSRVPTLVKQEAAELRSIPPCPSNIIDLTSSPVKPEPNEIPPEHLSHKAKGKRRAEEPSEVIDLTLSD